MTRYWTALCNASGGDVVPTTLLQCTLPHRNMLIVPQTAADVPGTNETTDKYYRAELANKDDWGQVTPANAMK
jgi:hypothetical protein